MSKTAEFCPNWASAPGETISDILDERGMSDLDFACQMELSVYDARDLLQGRATITVGIARRLEIILGASVEFWVSRDFQYREDIARINEPDQDWIAELPVGDMVKFGWLKQKPHPSEEVEACLSFFDVPSVGAWRKAYGGLQQMAAFRTSPTLDSRPGAVSVWLRQGEIEASSIPCAPWDVKGFMESLPLIRSLTREREPREFIPKLQQLCAENGVAVAVVRAPSGCRASGATQFLSADKALLLLSFRHLSDDQFWFTFFHEAGHLVLHEKTKLFLEGIDPESPVDEAQANEFAARILIPSDFHSDLLSGCGSTQDIVRLARKIGISPGIIVGQLQNMGKAKRNHWNGLKRRFHWEDYTSLKRGSS